MHGYLEYKQSWNTEYRRSTCWWPIYNGGSRNPRKRVPQNSFRELPCPFNTFNTKQALLVLSMCKDNCVSPHVSNCTEQSLTSSFLKTWEPHGARAWAQIDGMNRMLTEDLVWIVVWKKKKRKNGKTPWRLRWHTARPPGLLLVATIL